MSISLEDIDRFLWLQGLKMQENEILSLMRRYDRDGDGLLSVQEFEEFISPGHIALHLKRSQKPHVCRRHTPQKHRTKSARSSSRKSNSKIKCKYDRCTLRTSDMRQPSPTRDRTIHMLTQDIPLSEESLFVVETVKDRKGLIYLSDIKPSEKLPFR